MKQYPDAQLNISAFKKNTKVLLLNLMDWCFFIFFISPIMSFSGCSMSTDSIWGKVSK